MFDSNVSAVALDAAQIGRGLTLPAPIRWDKPAAEADGLHALAKWLD